MSRISYLSWLPSSTDATYHKNQSVSFTPDQDDSNDDSPFCRICLGTDSPNDLCSPCRCKGSLLHVHRSCLKAWLDCLHPAKSRIGPHGLSGIKCQSCGYTYQWGVSRIGRFISRYAQSIGILIVFIVFACCGDLWHNFDPIHRWFGETQFESDNVPQFGDTLAKGLLGGQPWARLNTSYSYSLLGNALCTPQSQGILHEWCIPSFLSFLQMPLAYFMALCSLAFEGWILCALIQRPTGYSLQPIFLSIHIIAYLTTGSLVPFNVFTLIDKAVFSLVGAIEALTLSLIMGAFAGVCSTFTIFSDLVDPSKFNGNIVEVILFTITSLTTRLYSGGFAPNCDQAVVRATEIASVFVTVLGATFKFMSWLWIWVLQVYYLLMLFSCFYDVAEDMVGAVRAGIMKRVEEDILDFEE